MQYLLTVSVSGDQTYLIETDEPLDELSLVALIQDDQKTREYLEINDVLEVELVKGE